MTNRIQQIPRRNWRERAAEARQLNALLRAPGGTQQLHDIQAVTLLEAWESGTGVNCYARVGAGKTIVMGLLPTLMAYHPLKFCRPLIVAPGSLVTGARKGEPGKTERDFIAARQHWKIVHQYWLASYTELAQESKADILEERQPDMLLFDEPDGLRRINATSRRIGRYIQSRREAHACPTHRQPQKEGERCQVCGGPLVKGLPTFCGFFHATPYRDAITDFSHMVNWALGERSPFPLDPLEVQQWSTWLDQEDASGLPAFRKYFDVGRGGLGGLGSSDVAASEDLFRERLTSTPGIILSDDTFTGSELKVRVFNVDPGLEKEFEQLRTLWTKPDGWQLLDAAESADPDEVNTWSIWAVARQMAMGMFYQACPTPPKDWMAARKAWCVYVQQLIDSPNSKMDTEKQVRTACEKAAERGRKVIEWETWKALKDTFTPSSVPVWMSTHALDAAKAWGSQAPGLIWVDHIAFGRRLSQETGWRFFGQRGLDDNGARIEDASPDRPAIASRLANQRGRNLQSNFNRNLIMAVPNSGVDFEQLLGRTHRHGQQSKQVTVDIYCACSEHAKALDFKLPKSSGKAERLLGLSQKILGVDIEEIGERPTSWAWR